MTTVAHDRLTDVQQVTNKGTVMQAINQDDYDEAEDVARLDEIDSAMNATQSIRKASTVAGVGLLAMSVLSAFGYLVAVKGLVVPGNAARTANKVGPPPK